VISRRAASEFPNDNPELHDGLVWACPDLRGRALPTLRMRPVSGAMPKVLRPVWELELEQDAEVEARAEPAPVLALIPEPVVAEAAPPVEISPFDVFTLALSRVAMARGATRAAAAATALLGQGRLAPESLNPGLLEALVRRRILASGSGHVTPEFAAATAAWRALLEGTEGDLAACGSSTLDAWAAELLVALLDASSSELPALKRELRGYGVAAFGLLAVA
jgi:hypothetical protein